MADWVLPDFCDKFRTDGDRSKNSKLHDAAWSTMQPANASSHAPTVSAFEPNQKSIEANCSVSALMIGCQSVDWHSTPLTFVMQLDGVNSMFIQKS
jgi:hypothetical protein